MPDHRMGFDTSNYPSYETGTRPGAIQPGGGYRSTHQIPGIRETNLSLKGGEQMPWKKIFITLACIAGAIVGTLTYVIVKGIGDQPEPRETQEVR